MIVFGSVMAIASGLASPAHFLMLGEILNFFIAYDVVNQLRSNFSNTSFEAHQIAELTGGQFCSENQTLKDSSFPRYITSHDIGDTLQSDVTLYVYYYLAMASALLITAFLALALWNWAAYRQTKRMRIAFFKSILHQQIGWFDVNSSSELSTHLSE